MAIIERKRNTKSHSHAMKKAFLLESRESYGILCNSNEVQIGSFGGGDGRLRRFLQTESSLGTTACEGAGGDCHSA
jgi:hypothetical protein